MNPASQLDFHPDAESLNAFVEQALADRERGQILAHLAACSRCRQVVYLAEETASVESTPAWKPESQSAARTAPWFRSWRFAWVPAAAFAAVIALLVFLHLPRPEPVSEVARVTPPVVPLNEGNASRLPLQERADAGKSQSPTLPNPNRTQAKKLEPAQQIAEPKALSRDAIASASLPSAAEAVEQSSLEHHATPLPTGASGQAFQAEVSSAQYKQEPAVEAWQQQQRAIGPSPSHVAAAKAAQTRMDSLAGGAQASRSATLAGSAPQFELPSASAVPFDVKSAPTTAGLISVGSAGKITLPSGLSAVSFATARHRILAIDKAGALFLSMDNGIHWDPIAPQWTGRAVTVRIPQTLYRNSASTSGDKDLPSGLSAAVASPAPTPMFEIVNDSHLVWVSADGKTWKER